MLQLISILVWVTGGMQNSPGISAPALKAALILRVAELEKNTAESGKDLRIYVLGAPELTKALEKLVGHNIGKSVLREVAFGDELPPVRPDIIFVGTGRNIEQVLQYTRRYKVLSITDRVDLFQRGVSVSILTERNRPKISLNSSSSVEEGLNWTLDFRMFRNMVLEFKSKQK